MSADNDPDFPIDASAGSASKNTSSRNPSSVSKKASPSGGKRIDKNSPSSNASDEKTPWWVRDTEQQLVPIRDAIRISAEPGYIAGDSARAANLEASMEPSTSTSTTTSKTSGERTGNSNKHWRNPSGAKTLASQMRAVATLVLNGEIDLDTARVYAAISRATVQALSVHVTQSRFSKQVPDLNFEDDLFDLDAGDVDVGQRHTPPSEDEGA